MTLPQLLGVPASKLTSILEETQGVQDQQLLDLEKKFEVIAMILITFDMQLIRYCNLL